MIASHRRKKTAMRMCRATSAKRFFEFYKSAPKTFCMPKWVLDWKESIKEMHAKAKSEKFQGAAVKIEADTSAAGDLLGEDQTQAVADNQSDKAQEQAAKEDDKPQETPSAQADTQKAEDTETVVHPSFTVGEIVLGLAKKKKKEYNDKKCKFISELTRHYKLEFLEGPAVGEIRNFTKGMVHKLPETVGENNCDVAAADTGAANTGAATSTDIVPQPTPKMMTPLAVDELWDDGF